MRPGQQAAEPTGASGMSTRAADVAAVLWPSFLSSCVASLLFFAAVDPQLLGDASPLFAGLDREAGYAIGFLFFWVITLVASALSAYLIRTRRDQQRREEPDPPAS